MICLCKAVLRALILLHVPRNGLSDFPRVWNKVYLPIIPQILLLVLLKTIIHNNLYHMLLHTKGHHTWHNLCKVLSHLSCDRFFDHPVYLKLSGESGGVDWEMLMSLWREILLQIAGNSSNITILPAPTAETQPCPLKPIQVQQCWTRRSGSVVTVTSCCKHVQKVPIHSVHPLPQKQLTGKEKDELSNVHSVYCRKWNTSTHLVLSSTTPLWNTHPHTNKEWKKKSVCEILVYLPGGHVLSGFHKNRDPRNRKLRWTVFSRC